MADEADFANDQLDSELSRAINRIRKNASVSTHTGTRCCVDCGEEIPDARRELGFRCCITCAQTRERQQSLFVDE